MGVIFEWGEILLQAKPTILQNGSLIPLNDKWQFLDHNFIQNNF